MIVTTPTIRLGDYVVIQRQKYTKLHKFGSLDATTMLGKEQLELKGIHGHPYGSTFKMCPKEVQQRRGPRMNKLHLCTDTEMRDIREVLGISGSGVDNRHLTDDGDSQSLCAEEIEQLREECTESTKIIEKIIENSKTFHAKTEYAQEKYLKKKEKKYFEYVQIRKPSIRLIAEIFYRQDAEKVMGLRVDTLSQLLSYSGVSAFGNYLLYESGTNGLLPASFLHAIGAGTEGLLVHMHPGNVPQKQAILALNFPAEQMQRCISVNIYSVLRQYYQGLAVDDHVAIVEKQSVAMDASEPCNKKLKLESETIEATDLTAVETKIEPVESTQKWKLENARACVLMRTQFDSLVIAAKEHPTNIVKSLLPFVKPSRPIVVFSHCKEVLMELYVDLKAGSEVTNLHLTSNWLRMYQIMPNRTHPEVNMNGNSGYLLSGYTIR